MLTIDQILAELREAGADDRWITPEGYRAVDRSARDYIFRYSKAMGAESVCSACGKSVDTRGKKHGDFLRCPNCGKVVSLREEWRGHKYLFEQGLDYIWKQSETDAETVIVTAIKHWRDFGVGNPELSQRKYGVEAIYQFAPNGARKYNHERRYDDGWKDAGFCEQKRGVGPVNMGWSSDNCSHHYMRPILSCTRIGKLASLIDSATADELNEIKVMGAICTKPYIEYLCAAKQPGLAAEIILGVKGIVQRPRAKDIRTLLGLTEGQWFEVRRDDIALTGETIHALNSIQRAGKMTISVQTAQAAARAHSYSSLYRLEEIAPVVFALVPDKLRRKAVRRAIADTELYTWIDYWQQLRALNEDMTDARILIPRDMHAMHQRMTDRQIALRHQKQAELNAIKKMEFAVRLKKLQEKYTFEACGLILRPFESVEEVIAEGTAQHICIGGYADRYVNGGTILCALRRAEAPEEPWRAVEFSATTGQLIQDRGAYNDRGRGEHNMDGGVAGWLRRFWAAFDARNTQKERVAA